MTPLYPPPRYAPWLVRLRLWPAVALCLFALLSDGVAYAVPPAPGAALKKFEEGVSAFTDNKPAEALQLFQASMELEPSPNTRFKIAKCFLALGRIGSAYSSFRRAAKEAQDRVAATGEQRFASTQVAAEGEVAQLEAQVPRVSLIPPADLPADIVAEVKIALDGGALPASILGSTIELDAGPHRLSATGPRIEPYELSVEAVAGENRRVELPLVRRKTGALVLSFIKRPVGLAVAIDDKPVSSALVDSPITLAVGLHKVVVSAPGYLDFSAKPMLHDEEKLAVTINLLPATRPSAGIPRPVFFATAAGTLVLLGIGIGYGVQAQNTANEQLSISEPLLRDPSVRDNVRVNATIANVFFGLGGALGIATIGIAIATRWRTPPARVAKPVASWPKTVPLLPAALDFAATEGGH